MLIAEYTILGLNVEGKKALLGLYLLKVKDILIATVDGLQALLKGFIEAIACIYPDTEVKLCAVRQIRNFMKDIASRNQK